MAFLPALAAVGGGGAAAGAGAGLGAGVAAGAGLGAGAAAGAGLGAGAAAATTAAAGLTGAQAAILGGSLLSAVTGVAGSIQQSRVQGDIADFQKGISDRNIAEAERSAEFNRSQLRSDSRRRTGALEARLGESGFQRSGSLNAVALDALIQSDLDSAVALSRGTSILNQQLVNRAQDSFRRKNARRANTERGIGAVAQGALDLGRFSILRNQDSLL